MTDRKRYSKAREERLRRMVEQAIMELRVFVLRGGMVGFSAAQHDDKVSQLMRDLPNKIAAEYRKKIGAAE